MLTARVSARKRLDVCTKTDAVILPCFLKCRIELSDERCDVIPSVIQDLPPSHLSFVPVSSAAPEVSRSLDVLDLCFTDDQRDSMLRITLRVQLACIVFSNHH
jgi:hypothetical protein